MMYSIFKEGDKYYEQNQRICYEYDDVWLSNAKLPGRNDDWVRRLCLLYLNPTIVV